MADYHISVEFLAGVLNYNPETKKVSPDSRRGKLVAFHDKNDEKRIQWFDLDNNNKEVVSLYIFQGDAKFRKVVKSAGRVYLLDFETNTDKYFFWLQEADLSKDAELEKKVNDVINFEIIEEENEPEPPQQNPAQISHPQPQQQLGGLPADPQKIQEMSNQLTQAFMHYAMNRRKRESPLLTDVLNSKFIDSVAEDEEYKQNLIPLLPDGQQTPEGLRENLKSPQFLQALETLEQALASEEGAAVLMSMGLDAKLFYETHDGVDALYNALIKFGKEFEKK